MEMQILAFVFIAIAHPAESVAITTSTGASVSLPCLTSKDYPGWRGPGSDGTDQPFNYDQNFTNNAVGDKNQRLSWDGKQNLMISDVVRTDAGNYTCLSQTVILYVRVKPSSVVIKNTAVTSQNSVIIQGNEGSALLLQCISSGGFPEQTVEWLGIDTTEVQSSKNVSFNNTGNTYNIEWNITFTPTAADDSKEYTCISSFHDEPKLAVDASARLNLNLQPEQPVLNQLGELVEGDNRDIANCKTGGFRPEGNFTLYWIYGNTTTVYNGKPVKNESTNKFFISANTTKEVTKLDNGQLLTCKVMHQTLKNPKTANISLQVQFAPWFMNISGNRNIVANGSNPLHLNCSTSSANPPSNIEWQNGTSFLYSNHTNKTYPGDYSGKVVSQLLILYPNRFMDGQNISCNGFNKVTKKKASSEVTLNLLYRPLINEIQPLTVVEGNYTLFECSAVSKPASTFEWLRNSNSFCTVWASVYYNRVVCNKTSVTRSEAGTYTCKADNGVGNADFKDTLLTVLYPPDVRVEGSNTSVNANSTILLCNARGLPNTNYTYGQWTQEWPGYGVVFTGPRSQILKVSPLTYEHSGRYKCSASNGIKLFNTMQEYMEGSLILQVKAFPVIIRDKPNALEAIKLAGSLGLWTSASLDYFSNTGAGNVSCYSIQNGTRYKNKTCTTSFNETMVNLEVFSHTVPTDGFRINVSIHINSQDDFGLYEVVVENEIGVANQFLQVDPKGPPSVPFDIQVEDVQQISAMISWIPGFHGGLDQTAVIQLQTDHHGWFNKTEVVQGQIPTRKTTILKGLSESNSYFLRMFAYNNEGRSNFTPIYNFTTLPKDGIPVSSPIVAGVAGGVVAFVLVAAITVVVVLAKRRGFFGKAIETSQLHSAVEEEDSSDDEMKPNPLYVSAGPEGQMEDKVYAKPSKKKQTNMTNSPLYSEVNRPKQTKGKQKNKGKPKTGKPIKDGDIYENSPERSAEANTYGNAGFDNTYELTDTSRKSTSGYVNKDGLVYADLEFNPTKAKKGKALVIHGSDDRTEYVDVDFLKRAEPLPDSDTEESNKASKK